MSTTKSTKKRQLLTIDDAIVTPKQHTKPCGDCPWARTAICGWLAGASPEAWVARVQGDGRIECHTKLRTDTCEPRIEGAWECAGAAIMRGNMCKLSRGGFLRLGPDRLLVFATPVEFMGHHARRPRPGGIADDAEEEIRIADDDGDTDTDADTCARCGCPRSSHEIGRGECDCGCVRFVG
jgi:hypothetical protein